MNEPTLDPSTDAGWRAWDVYLRKRAVDGWAAADLVRIRDIASREALAAAQEHLAQANQAMAAAQVRAAEIFAAIPSMGHEAAVLIEKAVRDAPDDWINRSIMLLSQYRTALDASR